MGTLLSIGLLFLAGFSGIVLLTRPIGENIALQKLLLAFSGAFLLGISLLHLIPEVYHADVNSIGLFVLLGFIIQLFLEYFSKGLEHGHAHVHASGTPTIPYTVIASLCIHAFIEGMPVEGHSHEVGHDHAGDGLLYGVVMHKIPVSIALASLIMGLKLPTRVVVFTLLIFALMAPLGYWTNHQLAEGLMQTVANYSDILLAIIIGMFLHISTTILFEATENHRFNLLKFSTVLLGSLLAWAIS